MTEQNALPEWMDNGFAIAEPDMSRDYLRAETKWRGEASRFWQQERELRAKVRRSLDLDEDDRALVYQVEYRKIEEAFKASADGFTNYWLQERRLAHERVYRNLSDGFRSSLLSAMALPDDALEGTLNVAQRSGQRDLAQAVAQVALERGDFGLFECWGRENSDKASALRLLRRVPGFDQLTTRVHKAMKPPRPDNVSQLRPGHAEVEAAREAEENSRINAQTREFFGNPSLGRRRGRGRRVS
jgi:hypothetical protein